MIHALRLTHSPSKEFLSSACSTFACGRRNILCTSITQRFIRRTNYHALNPLPETLYLLLTTEPLELPDPIPNVRLFNIRTILGNTTATAFSRKSPPELYVGILPSLRQFIDDFGNINGDNYLTLVKLNSLIITDPDESITIHPSYDPLERSSHLIRQLERS